MRFLPHTSFMAPRKMMESPMVRKISTRWFCDRDGRMPMRSTAMPTAVTAATAQTRAITMGRPPQKRPLNRNMPPKETKSTWVKFTIPMVL